MEVKEELEKEKRIEEELPKKVEFVGDRG